MKRKLFVIVFMICNMLSSCTKAYKDDENIEIPDHQNSTVEYSSSLSGNFENHDISENWEMVDKRSYDIDNDKKENSIALYWINMSNGNGIPKLKIEIDNKEKVFEFKSISIIKVSLKQFINLDKGNKGLLIKLSSEGETESQPFDHSFLVVGYRDQNIEVLLDGLNQRYNSENNYTIKYIDGYEVEFGDSATGFNAKYSAKLYKSAEDGIERLRSINNRQTSGISYNYYRVKSQDLDSDGVDEIVCSKFIPGLYHADTLGSVDYTFTMIKDKYYISSERLTYDTVEGLVVIKEMDIK